MFCCQCRLVVVIVENGGISRFFVISKKMTMHAFFLCHRTLFGWCILIGELLLSLGQSCMIASISSFLFPSSIYFLLPMGSKARHPSVVFQEERMKTNRLSPMAIGTKLQRSLGRKELLCPIYIFAHKTTSCPM